MDRAERAQRLYRIGLEHCRARDFDMCRATMQRVADLSETLKGRAIRLQVWAEAQRHARQPEAMPDVGTSETLRDFDRRLIEGKDRADAGR